MAIPLPALWMASLTKGYNEGEKPEFGIVFSLLLGFFLYVSLNIFAMYATAYSFPQSDWFTTYFREKPQIPLLASVCLIVLGTLNFFFSKPSFTKIKKVYDYNKKNMRPAISYRVLFIILFVSTVSFVPSLVIRLSAQPYRPIADSQFTVMSLNVRQGFGVDNRNNFVKVRNLITMNNAKIVGLQQADTLRISSSNADLYEYLNHHLGMFDFVGPSSREYTIGCGILSMFPLVETKFVKLPTAHGEPGGFAQAYVCLNETDNYYVYFLATHFGSYKANFTDQTNSLIEYIEEIREAIVDKDFRALFVGGDLNMIKNSTDMVRLSHAARLQNTLDKAQHSNLPIPESVLTDFILYNIEPRDVSSSKTLQQVQLVNFTVIADSGISPDHFPLSAQFLHWKKCALLVEVSRALFYCC